MDIHDKIKEVREEEKEKYPPPYTMQMSTPGHIKQNAENIKARLCRVYDRDEMFEYKKEICKRVRKRFEELGIELNIYIEQEF